jgi:succinate-acetate transporter protein
MTHYLIKLFLSAAIIATVTEVAKRNNFAASIIHSLPITSLLAFIWLYLEKRDEGLIARHSFGTFWFVLPTLPMFLVLPWLLNHGLSFWPALGLCIAVTVLLYLVTMKLLSLAGVQL